MKLMRFSLYLNDYETEKLFSTLRWLFVVIATLIFYVPPFSDNITTNKTFFPYLLVSGVIYMLVTQIALIRARDDKKSLQFILKAGIIFDFLALIWLMYLSEGIHSPLYPISILFVMHATIYWRTKGALISLAVFSLAYLLMGILTVNLTDFQHYFTLFFNLFFLWIIGLFGALIMLRERAHYAQKEAYHHLARRDYLSGLFNQLSFQEKFKRKVDANESFTLLLGDIDDFKKVNDDYGHLTGDEVIRKVGAVFRTITEPYKGQAFRYGGEEFVILLPQMDEHVIQQFLKDLYYRLEALTPIAISMSFGQAETREANDPEKLIALADQRLYVAKKAGKGRTCLANDELYIPSAVYR
ncbi:GGDEF domain-containing protein [Rossellomorea aquimaris]|uniref:GGDEF domain-containing protein n=2 Tax=Rossellomorea aquimaris TaxID=189382 RepID=A0A5D4UEK6_9BACI|nr:GGDEF domain-containing protein [Rossellomorea aquimaris]TYS85663.1 GGDEF domain-containing protein [Rossellomorea aquimaris]